MGYLTEDPTYLVAGLGLLALVSLALLKATQQGGHGAPGARDTRLRAGVGHGE